MKISGIIHLSKIRNRDDDEYYFEMEMDEDSKYALEEEVEKRLKILLDKGRKI